MSYIYELEALNEQERAEYVSNLCKNLNLPDNLGLIMLGYIEDASGGPRRLVPWIKRAGTEKIRADRGISVISSEDKLIGDTIMFEVAGVDKDGRREVAIGAKSLTGLEGDQKAEAIMTASTRANRRLTLQFVGAGVLDESEVSGKIKDAPTGPVSKLTLAEGKRNNTPGKDVTVPEMGTTVPETVTAPVEPPKETQEEFEARMKKLRDDAIAFLNKSTKPLDAIEEKVLSSLETQTKPRKARAKKTIDIGPSEPIPAAPIQATVKPEQEVPVQAAAPVTQAVAQPPAPPVVTGKRLTPEQVKPFRQRLFRIVNDYLEPSGFAPKEGIGNADKMRQFANVMFPEVNNMNELTVEQWEKYLTALEQKIQKEGASATVTYIEDAIGI